MSRPIIGRRVRAGRWLELHYARLLGGKGSLPE